MCFNCKGFHDDREEKTCGIVKKGIYTPSSDFHFDLVAEVICAVTSSSGYLISLTPYSSEDTRYVRPCSLRCNNILVLCAGTQFLLILCVCVFVFFFCFFCCFFFGGGGVLCYTPLAV